MAKLAVKTSSEWVFFWPSLVFLCIESVGVVLLILAIQSHPIIPLGYFPTALFKDEKIIDYESWTDEKADDWQYVGIMLNCCESIEDKINHNDAMNSAIARKVNKALWLCGLIAPIAFVMLSLVVFYR